MADTYILSWNTTNWITVVLMVALGFFVIGMVATIYKNSKAAS